MWQRWNQSTHIFEVSSDNGGVWNPLPLNASVITEGVIDAARLPSLSAVWPVGSIFISAVSTNPATLLGFGTWVAFATGRTIVGIDAGQTEFDTVEETGGSKTHTLSTAEMPSHTHTQDSHNHTQNSHNHTQDAHNHTQNAHSHTNLYQGLADVGGGPLPIAFDGGGGVASNTVLSATATNIATTATNQATTATNQATTATNQNTGGGGAHNNLQPYIVVYMWKRTA